MIIAIMAMQRGLHDVVKASLTGSIIGNILLVMGASALAGGLKFKTQEFNVTAARIQATMLTLAAVALIVPAAFHYLSGPAGVVKEFDLSFDISIVLLITYALSLLFSLHTHKQLFAGHSARSGGRGRAHASWPIGKVDRGACRRDGPDRVDERDAGRLRRGGGARLRYVDDFRRRDRGRDRRQCGRAQHGGHWWR